MGVSVPLALGAQGVSNTFIGIIAGIYSGGFMLGALLAPRVIRGIGNIRCFAFASGAAASSTLMLAMFPDPFIWSAMRFVQGFGIALMFASDESWMTEATPASQRGAVLGVHHVVAKIALLLGPFLAIGKAPDDPQAFIWCGLFLTLALIPITLTRVAEPAPPDPSPYPLSRMFGVAPAAVIGVFIAGFSNTGFLALLPIYAEEGSGASISATAATLMAAAWIGGMISQFPAGFLSDRVDRRLVIAGMGVLSGIAGLTLALLNGHPQNLLVLGLVGLWGAGALSFYGLCVAHAADRCEPQKIARMLSGLLFVWASGSVIGPIVFGLVMSLPLGVQGLFIMEALIGFLLAFFMVWRRQAHAPVTDEEREPFEPVQPTSIAGLDIDPRTDLATEAAE